MGSPSHKLSKSSQVAEGDCAFATPMRGVQKSLGLSAANVASVGTTHRHANDANCARSQLDAKTKRTLVVVETSFKGCKMRMWWTTGVR
jgi:hypothetical protein